METTQIQQLQQLLLDNGIPKEDLMKAYAYIDEYIMEQISTEAVDTLSDDQKKAYEKLLDNHADPDEVAAFLHITEDDFIEKYTQKLTNYIKQFPIHLPSLREALSTATAN